MDKWLNSSKGKYNNITNESSKNAVMDKWSNGQNVECNTILITIRKPISKHDPKRERANIEKTKIVLSEETKI